MNEICEECKSCVWFICDEEDDYFGIADCDGAEKPCHEYQEYR